MARARLANIRVLNVLGARTADAVSDERAVQTVFRILEENVLCSIATVTAGNRAHINTAYYCYSENIELYFLSHPGSLHCKNLLANSSAAMTIFSSSQNWADPDHGLQLFGTCHEVGAQDSAGAERLYAERFPAYFAWRRTLAEGDLALAYRFFEFVPENVKILDEKEFGDAVFVCAEVRR